MSFQKSWPPDPYPAPVGTSLPKRPCMYGNLVDGVCTVCSVWLLDLGVDYTNAMVGYGT